MSKVSGMTIEKIVADGDLDGLISAAIVQRYWPDAVVVFSHPAEIRRGDLDSIIDLNTAVLDLPFHPHCGLHIDHHLTNKPSPDTLEEAGKYGRVIVWEEALSAARVCYNAFAEICDLSDFEAWLDMVDRLDGGKITQEEFLSNHPIVWIGRTINPNDNDYCQYLLECISEGLDPEQLKSTSKVSLRIEEAMDEFHTLQSMLDGNTSIIDRLAIVRLEDTGVRTNGYLVTAHFGDKCDACMIIHGYHTENLGSEKWPLSASFYSNSFLHPNGGLFDLTKLATAFDIDGGGHADACGCRIQPLTMGKKIEDRGVKGDDIEENISCWLDMWSHR